ncbi:MAG TPA: hemerythrin domain-containing protein [Pyrinomonadaceae bacterium]|nr:hemerythrin domain-containing protein [Pyrinomonadaceae bacterium]
MTDHLPFYVDWADAPFAKIAARASNNTKDFLGGTMNAIELLKADHKVVDGLFQKVKAGEEEDQRALFEQIKAELDVHAHIEEAVFYPRLIAEGDTELADIVKEGIEEHHQVKIFLREISALAEESEKFEPKLMVLMENVEHHVMEEEGEMFQMVEEQFDPEVLEELGREMEEERQNFNKTQSARA